MTGILPYKLSAKSTTPYRARRELEDLAEMEESSSELEEESSWLQSIKQFLARDQMALRSW